MRLGNPGNPWPEKLSTSTRANTGSSTSRWGPPTARPPASGRESHRIPLQLGSPIAADSGGPDGFGPSRPIH